MIEPVTVKEPHPKDKARKHPKLAQVLAAITQAHPDGTRDSDAAFGRDEAAPNGPVCTPPPPNPPNTPSVQNGGYVRAELGVMVLAAVPDLDPRGVASGLHIYP